MSEHDKFNVIDEKIDHFLGHMDIVYQVVPATSFGFAAVIISSSAILISLLLYLTVDPTFSIFTHWISNLGSGPNGSNIVFNVGIAITSMLLFLFYMYFIKDFRKKKGKKILVDLFFVSTCINCFGLFFVAIFPYTIPFLHGIAAFAFFIGGFISSILYAILILLTKGSNKILAVFSFIATGFCGFHLINSVIIAQYIGIEEGVAQFTEWLTLFAMLALVIEIGFYQITEKKIFYKKLNNRIIDMNYFNPRNIIKLRKFIKSLYQKKEH